MQKDADTQARHPKFATDLFEGMFKNADFRNEFAQRSMVYLRTFMRGTTIATLLDEMVADAEISSDVIKGEIDAIVRDAKMAIEHWSVDSVKRQILEGAMARVYTLIEADKAE